MLTRQQFCRGLVLFCLPFGDARSEGMAMTFDCRDYWPFPGIGNQIINHFDNAIIQTYSTAPGGMPGIQLSENINGAWNDSWFYYADPVRGILEYSDWYPGKKWYQPSVVKQPCVSGKEIIWGGIQKVGDTIEGQCVTSGIFGQYGWQRVRFDAILPTYTTPAGTFGNVLVLDYWQSWGTGIKGAKMWFAPGLGQIRAEWTLNAKPTGYAMTLQSTTKWVPVS